MNRLVCVLAVCLAAVVSASGETPTNLVSWAAVPFAETQAAAYKRVDSVTVLVRPVDGRITLVVRYTMFDAAGNALRTGLTEYAQAALADKLQAGGETLARLKAMIGALAVQ